jgi:hypothetical protein
MSAGQGETASKVSEERSEIGENSKGTGNSEEDHSNNEAGPTRTAVQAAWRTRVTARVKPTRVIPTKRTLAPRNDKNKSGSQRSIIHQLEVTSKEIHEHED